MDCPTRVQLISDVHDFLETFISKAVVSKTFNLQRKTWSGWAKEENAANEKAFACHFAQRKQPMHYDVLLAIKHFPILEKRGVLKVKNKVRNEILKMDTSEH